MADVSMNGRGFAPQAGSYQAYQSYQTERAAPHAGYAAPHPSAPNVPNPPNSPRASAPRSNSVSAAAAFTGAALSVALLVGVGYWGYSLMVRDVAGVPVVRAVQGEMRVRPESPGGRQAQNQGLAVNEVAAAGGTAGPSERIVLAPEPIDLSDTSTPLIDQLAQAQPRFGAQAGTTEPVTASPVAPAAQPSATATLAAPAQQEAASPQMASIEALAAQIAAGATPLEQRGAVATPPVKTQVATLDPAATAAPAAPSPQVQAIAGASGVATSLRPRTRPEGIRTASLDAAAPDGVRDIDPASIAAGTRLVQLGAYESPEIARREWDRFSTRFAEYMSGKDRVVQRAQSGGRTFYRLRAMGFEDLSDARRFCSALAAQNTDCIPVVTR